MGASMAARKSSPALPGVADALVLIRERTRITLFPTGVGNS